MIMALRSSWEGFLKLSLISVPIKAYTTLAREGQRIHFHQIHAGCGSRVRHQKVCPIHGEVNKDEIVSGYEYSKDNHVLVDPDELAELRPDDEKTIEIDAFVDADAVDPIYFSGRSYYLTPEGKTAQRSYAVILEAMSARKRCAMAQVILSGRRHLALLQPGERFLTMSVLNYDEQVAKPAAFEEEAADVKVSKQELELAESLIDASAVDHFDISHYHDEYESDLRKLIEAKAKGKKITGRRAAKEPAVINLMDALKKSLGKVQKRTTSRRPTRPARRKTG
jgi:DNA end-binding protein Ku